VGKTLKKIATFTVNHNQKSWEMGVYARHFIRKIKLSKSTPSPLITLANGIVVSKIFADDADTFFVF